MIWLLPLLVACHVPYKVPREPVDGGGYVAPEDGWQRARSELVHASACLADVDVYCLTDDERVEDAIQEDLDQHHHGRMPTNERWLTEHINRARAEWNNDMKRDKQQIEKLVKENWSDPHVGTVKGRADVYLHVPPSNLVLHYGKWKGVSKLVERGELTSDVLLAQLEAWAEARPKARVVRLILDIPQADKGFERLDVRWFKARDEIVVYRPGLKVAWSTGEAADLEAVARGQQSLHTDDLMPCAIQRVGEVPDCTVVPDDAAYKKRKKKKKKKKRPATAEAPVSKAKGKAKGKAKNKGKAKGKGRKKG